MSDKPITVITLAFPDGITMKEAQAIAIEADRISNIGMSQGGYKCLTPANLYFMDGPVEWSESEAEFIFTYPRKKS